MKHSNTSPKKFELLAFMYICAISYGTALLIRAKFSKIDPPNPIDQVSAVAFGQIIFWVTGFIAITLTIILFQKKIVTVTGAIQFYLVTLIGSVSGVITGSALLALRGTQWYFGLLGGDLGVHLKHAQNALEVGWDKSGYPPLWATLVGNICRVFHLDVYVAHKYISIFFIAIWIGITYVVIRQALPPILSEILALTYTSSLAVDGWKTAAEFWTQILLLALIKVIYDLYTNQRKQSIKTRIYLASLGFTFGCAIGLYFGRIWWIGYAIAFAIFISNFVPDPNKVIRTGITDFFISAVLPLIPTILMIEGNKLGLSVEDNLFQVYASWIIFCVLWYFVKVPNKIISGFSQLFTVIFPISILFIFQSVKIGDTFTDEGKMFKNNFVPNLSVSPFLIFIIIFVFGSLIAFGLNERSEMTFQIIFLISCSASAILKMYIYAYEMHLTGAVELFPRAGFAISDTWNIQILIYTYLLFAAVFIKYQNLFIDKWQNNQNSVIPLFLAIGIAVIAYVASDLGSVQWALFPRPENEAYYAWISSGWTPK